MASSGTLKVDVNPEVIVWARTSIGYTVEEAAAKVNIPLEKLLEVEAGGRSPSLSQLRRMADKYKRPLAVLFLPEVPKDFGVARLQDFRRLPEAEERRSPALNRAVRKAEYRRELLLDLASTEGTQIRRFRSVATFPDSPEVLGQRARRLIGVPIEVQQKWPDSRAALKAWRAAFSQANILVFQAAGVDLDEMRGFSLHFDRLPVIVVNRKDSPNGRIFTIFHELAHLLVRQSGLCDLVETSNARIAGFRIEAFCNRASAAALVPESDLLGLPAVREWRELEWPDSRIRSLARTFSVSAEVVLRRLLDLGRTTKAFYAMKREEYRNLYDRRERQRQESPQKGFLPPSTEAVGDGGHFFVSTVLDALYQDRITISDASDYLGVRVKHLSKIEELIAKEANSEATT